MRVMNTGICFKGMCAFILCASLGSWCYSKESWSHSSWLIHTDMVNISHGLLVLVNGIGD